MTRRGVPWLLRRRTSSQSLRHGAALPLFLERVQQSRGGIGGYRLPIDGLHVLVFEDVGQAGPEQGRFADPRFAHHDDEGDLVIENQAQQLRQFVIASQAVGRAGHPRVRRPSAP